MSVVVVGLCIFLMQDLAYHIVLLMSNLLDRKSVV